MTYDLDTILLVALVTVFLGLYIRDLAKGDGDE